MMGQAPACPIEMRAIPRSVPGVASKSFSLRQSLLKIACFGTDFVGITGKQIGWRTALNDRMLQFIGLS
jgi:hypothetical protein